MSLIRTYSYLKYARINLDEASEALAAEEHDRAASKSLDAASAMMKAVAAAMPTVEKDFFRLKERALARYLEDISPEAGSAGQLAQILYSLVRWPLEAGSTTEDEARRLMGQAGQALAILQEIFPNKRHPLA